MRIGIFGGTFDPPHVGHLILAEECRFQLNLDRLLWVLTNQPPHKKNSFISPIDDRIALVAKAIDGNPAFELSRVDIDRPGPHYSLDTVLYLKKQFPGDELIYLMGGDSLHDLPTWSRPKAFLAACDELGVMRRYDDKVDINLLEKALPGITQKVHLIEAPILEISSHQIRQRVHEGQGYRYYLPDAVYRAIEELNLYR